MKTVQLLRKTFSIELWVGARTRYMPDIDDNLDFRGAKKIHELGDRSCRMSNSEKVLRQTEDQAQASARNVPISAQSHLGSGNDKFLGGKAEVVSDSYGADSYNLGGGNDTYIFAL